MVEKSPVFDLNLQEQLLLDYNNKLQEWDKLIANKKSLMTIIFGPCNDTTRTKIALGASYKADYEAEELIKFLTRVHIVCNANDNEDLLFPAHVAKIAKHNFRPVWSVEELLVAHPINDAI